MSLLIVPLTSPEWKRPNSISTRAFVVTDPVIPWCRLFRQGEPLRRFELAASLLRFYFLKAELLVELIVRLTVDLDIRVDEIIERWAILLRRQCDVAAGG